jgi:tetratricopeptide (TPR) repeat protein
VNRSYGILGVLLGAAIVLIQPQAAALTAGEINQIAAGITVLIDGINSGSGVIIARESKTYYVLTAKHVVSTEDEYTIVTPDGNRYPLNYSNVRKLPGADLAIIQFSSDRNYEVATLADYNYDTEAKHVFISGWSASNENGASRNRRFSPGLSIPQAFALAHAKDPISDSYELFYTCITETGMSGGPVLDIQGRVIGIHGKTEGEEIKNKLGELSRLQLGFSSGIPIKTFFKLIPQVGMQLMLNSENSPPSPLTDRQEKSIAAFVKVPIAIESDNPVDWVNRGNQLYRLERFADALAAFDRAIQLKPDLYQAWYGRALVSYTSGQYSSALASFNRVIQLEPDFFAAWRDRGVVLTFLKEYRAAIASFDRALQIDPKDYVTWYMRGNIFKRYMQQDERAIAAYDRAIQLKPNFALAWVRRGEALYDLQRYDEAREAFDRALQIAPDLMLARQLRDRL